MLDYSFWDRIPVLVTGHTGFKGSWLLLLLERLGSQTFGYSLPPDLDPSLYSQLSEEGNLSSLSSSYEGDIRDLELLKNFVNEVQPKVVFHLAAQPLVRSSYVDPLYTWSTNVQGSLNVLESLKCLKHKCAVVMITTDKVYKNQEWIHGYRETDPLGGHDPYSASKAAAEIAISSWRSSFCGTQSHQTPYLNIATARAGNVIGGGDWSLDRIVPDAVRALVESKPIGVRNPNSTRPWQHVLDPLNGYLTLAEHLCKDTSPPCEAFNFGPYLESNQKVSVLVDTIINHWDGQWLDQSSPDSLHEASLLHLQIDKAFHLLKWKPKWDYQTTIERTIKWYKSVNAGSSPYEMSQLDLDLFFSN